MSAPSAPWTTRIFELLADGPKSLEFLIAEVRNMVPPGRAYRQAEKKRQQMAARRVNKTGRTQWRPPATDDETIRTGQRQIVMDSVTKLVMRGRLEYIDGTLGRYVRLGRDTIPGGMAQSPLLSQLREHQPTYSKRKLDGIAYVTGRPIYGVDITCSCGWTWQGAERNEDGLWEIYATSKDAAEIEFTKHRRASIRQEGSAQ